MIYLAVMTALAVGSTTPGVREDTVALGGRRAVVWLPTASPATRRAVVIFSHGLGGCPTQSRFLTAGLAARGYVVIAPFHRDAGCGRRGPGIGARARPPVPGSEPERWDDRSFADRLGDVYAVVAALPTSSLKNEVDVDRIAVAGHSLGGYTALGLAGGWSLAKIGGVRAVLALAPYTTPFLVHGTLPEISTPVMYQTGALDVGTTFALAKRNGTYEQTGGPKYLVEFSRAKHSSWGNHRNAAQDAMLSYAAAFLDQYVRGAARESVLTRKLAGVAELRFDPAIPQPLASPSTPRAPRLPWSSPAR
jgi:dienelactone hydrolase